MARIEMHFTHKEEVTATVCRVGLIDFVHCWWEFEYDDRDEIIKRPADEVSNVHFQAGSALGGGGHIYLCTNTDSEMIMLRMKAGL